MAQISDRKQNLIDCYFEEGLDEDQAALFQKYLLEDPDFKAEFELEQRLNRSMGQFAPEAHPYKDLKLEFQQLEKKIANRGRIIKMTAALTVAASVILAVLLFPGLIGGEEVQNVVAQSLLLMPAQANLMSDDADHALLEEAKSNFFAEQPNYRKAIGSLQRISTSSKVYAESQYLLGYAYFKLEDYGKAVHTFQQFIDQPEQLNALPPAYRNDPDRLRWSYVLALYGNGDTEQVKAMLPEFLNHKSNAYKTRAAELQQAIQ